MRVSVGSGNPVKIAAVERALSDVAGVTVEGVEVDSGVAEQPRGRTETISGAENRAESALEAGEYDLGVGVEGGVAEHEDGLYLIMWAAVTDGERATRGAGPTIRLPESMAEPVGEGRELGPVVDEVLGAENVAEGAGAAGVLTGRAIDRESSLTHAVAAALGPFVTGHYE
ncbi:inosine/xanthosine triphosphatase [Natronoarchaeum philippinense]|uniref:Probable inosine/xanthosine triphosphatase n=1 Tax=Natronoarchaeum philippinense TaxID=558529 RepID=A0A285NUY3_NATPI|nr:inosine/xanthosine triphosphatase [Natronoarchaeum philippinense]SNZ13280.1 inosine/xanthosine triphosphatase [Natronoarchaeum philippinense]